jgi:hypothetical protein
MSREVTTIDYKALTERIDLYAQLGVEGCDRWRDDLRTVVTMLNEAAEARPVAWMDEFGNAFPLDAWKPAKRTYLDDHKNGWKPLYLHPAPQPNWQPVPPRACIKPTHEAADAFWRHWRENGETHKHGYYESTWGAINAALACGWTEPAPQPQPVLSGYGDYGAAIPGIERPCTCHPDDNPPVPCAQKYALSECRAASEPTEVQIEAWAHEIWAAAQTAPCEGIENAVDRIVGALRAALAAKE